MKIPNGLTIFVTRNFLTKLLIACVAVTGLALIPSKGHSAVICDMHVKYPGRRANPLVPAGDYRINGEMTKTGYLAPVFERRVTHHHSSRWVTWGQAEGGPKISVNLEGRPAHHRGSTYSLRLLFVRDQGGSCHLDGSLQGWS